MADEVEMYKALVAEPGVYLADGGPINITRERIARWEREFNRFQAAGYSIPTPWGHKLGAVPLNLDDPYAADEAAVKANAGYVEKVYTEPKTGALWMLAHVPPGYRVDKKRKALVNERDGTVVREVSPGFGDMLDGKGRQHRDVLFHVALCTHPVQPKQPGFEDGGRMAARPSPVRFMSTAGRITKLTFLGGKAMPDPIKKKEEEAVEAEIPAIEAAAAEGAGAGGEAPIAPAAEEPAVPVAGDDGTVIPELDLPGPGDEPIIDPEPDVAGLGGGANFTAPQVEQIKQIMAQLGSPMLPDTTPANIVERLLVVLHAAANQGASLSPSAGAQGPEPLDLSAEGGVPDPNATGGGMGGLGTGTFMHHKTGTVVQLDQSGRSLALNAARTHWKEIVAEWDKVGKLGNAALKALCEEEKRLAGRFHLSLNPETGQVLIKGALARLAVIKKFLAASGVYKIRQQLSRATPSPNPAALVKQPVPRSAPVIVVPDADLKAEIARLVPGANASNIVIRRTDANGQMHS